MDNNTKPTKLNVTASVDTLTDRTRHADAKAASQNDAQRGRRKAEDVGAHQSLASASGTLLPGKSASIEESSRMVTVGIGV